MSSTLLEQTRSHLEEIERLERSVVEDLKTEPSSSRDRLLQGHRIRRMIDSIMLTSKKVIETYEDPYKAREDEISELASHKFYDALKDIREYHKNRPSGHLDANEDSLMKEEPVLNITFSGEEGHGRYLDLHEMYNQYINSKFGEKVEYSAYLNVFPQLENIPCKLKFSRQYRDYMEDLLKYLVYFLQRTEPLQDVDRILSKVEIDFEDGKVQEVIPSQHNVIDLDYYTRVEELIDVGPEKLKEALGALGLKVGGTLQQRAERLFLTKHTPLEKLDKKHFAKLPQNGDAKEIALREAKVKKLCDLLDETIERTKQNVANKQGLKYEELEKERERDQELGNEESEIDDEEENDGGEIYNPLKLPMGLDGKPIPYWLYSLHGLRQEFKCEICGNVTYRGRREFERHFKLEKHQHGMRCLGIPNNKNFNEITSIEEARELWKRIQEKQEVKKWRPEVEEEYEDRQGNVYSKKIYSDLQRQGLI